MIKVKRDLDDVWYDAEKEEITFQFRNTRSALCSAMRDGNERTTLETERVEKHLGTYTAQTLLGQRVTVERLYITSYYLCETGVPDNPDSDPVWQYIPFKSNRIKYKLRAEPEIAKRIKKTAYFLVSFVPRSVWREEWGPHEPTVDFPSQLSGIHNYLVGDMQCLAILTPADGVIATLPMR